MGTLASDFERNGDVARLLGRRDRNVARDGREPVNESGSVGRRRSRQNTRKMLYQALEGPTEVIEGGHYP